MSGPHGYLGTSVPATTAFQASLNGLLIGDGTDFNVETYEGLDSLAPVQKNDSPIGRDAGEYQGAYYAGGREIHLKMELATTSDANLRTDLDALGLATAPIVSTEVPLYFTLPGMTQASRLAWVRPLDRVIVTDIDYVYHKARCMIRLHATDPRIYDSTLQNTGAIALPSGSGGLTWPITWPASWGSSSSAGSAVVNNAGTYGSRPVAVITGPVDNPIVTNLNTGAFLQFGITLGNSDTLTIDFLAKTILLNGTASRRNTMTATSNWWELAPGNTTVTYRANTVQTGSTMTLYWQSAWI